MTKKQKKMLIRILITAVKGQKTLRAETAVNR